MHDSAATQPLPGWFRAAAGAFAAALAAFVLVFAAGGITGIAVPELLETGEPYIVSAAWNLGQGGNLYAPVDDLPFLHNNYNPLVQTLAAPILAWSGPAYWPMRALTFAAAIALLAILTLTVRREGGGAGTAFAAAALPLSCGFVFPWLCLGRVDVFAAMLSTAAVAWAFAHRDGGVARRRWWILLAVLAFAAKQTMIAGPAAVLAFAAIRGRFGEAVRHGLLYAAGCVVAVGAAQWLSGGQYWLHAVTYNASHDRGGWWPEGLPPAELAWAFGPVLLAAAVLGLPLADRKRQLPWLLWLAFAFPSAFFFVRKSGSHVHYFLESVAALSVCVTLAFEARLRTWRARPDRRALAAAAIVLAGLAGAAAVQARHHHWPALKHLHGLRTRPDPVPAEVRRLVREGAHPPLLTAKLGSLAIEEGRPAVLDIADFVRLQELGRWRAGDRLVPLILAGRFPVIGLAEFPEGDSALAHFDARRLDGVVEAVEAAYRKLPLRLDDPKTRKWGSFWVPKERR